MLFDKSRFPHLTPENHQVTSPATEQYTCIAWAAGHSDEWYEPVAPYYWPDSVPRDYSVQALIKVYEREGFSLCGDADLEQGYEKIAIYADGHEYMHAALQLENGKWTSKMGAGEDIEHDTFEAVSGPEFGQVAIFMKRPCQARASS
jgi:hypothetical protein